MIVNQSEEDRKYLSRHPGAKLQHLSGGDVLLTRADGTLVRIPPGNILLVFSFQNNMAIY
jgi:hypothetical protein